MEQKKKRLRNDLLLAGAVLLLALAGFLLFQFSKTPGQWAVVLIDGKETARYPLSEDMETVIRIGDDTNTLVISGGAASIREANCPDGICVAHRAVSQAGETIVCLPHKVVVKIEAADSSGTVDIGA